MTFAVIFDLDGTLLDSLDDLTDALNIALAAHGFPPAASAQVRGWIGSGVTILCRRALPNVDDDTIARVRDSLLRAYDSGCLNRSRWYPGIREMLRKLADSRTRMAVLSNKPDPLTQRIVDALADPGAFAWVRGVREESERKPSLGLARGWLDRIGADPAHAYFVGDSLIDIQTARAAGMKSVAVGWGFTDVAELRAAAPDYLCESAGEILRLPGLEPPANRG